MSQQTETTALDFWHRGLTLPSGVEVVVSVKQVSAPRGVLVRLVDPEGIPLHGWGITEQEARESLVAALLDTYESLEDDAAQLAPALARQLASLRHLLKRPIQRSRSVSSTSSFQRSASTRPQSLPA